MGIEIERSERQQEHIVYQLSEVVETIMLAAAISRNEKPENSHHAVQVYMELQAHPAIKKLHSFGESGLFALVNLLLPVPEFLSVERFVEKLAMLSREELLYFAWDEWVDRSLIKEVLVDPDKIYSMEETLYLQTDEERENVFRILINMQTFQDDLCDFLLSIGTHQAFKTHFKEKSPEMARALKEVEALNLEPLQRAQYVMGKTFRRVSPYKMYYYIPSHSFSSSRVRVFNEDVCIIIFGSSARLIDRRERNAQLAKQLKVIADPTRLQLLSLISSQKEYGARLAEYLGVTTATVSHHIETLKKVSLITEEKIGTIKYFSANREQVEKLIAELRLVMSIK